MKQSAISHKVQGAGSPLQSPSSPILCFFAVARAFGAPCALRARARGRTQATYLGDARDAAASTSLCGQGSRLQLLGTGECSRNWKWMSRHCALSSGACLG